MLTTTTTTMMMIPPHLEFDSAALHPPMATKMSHANIHQLKRERQPLS